MRAISSASFVVSAITIAGGAADGALGQQSNLCYGLQEQYLAALQGSGLVAGGQNSSQALAAAEQAASANHCMSLGIFSPPPTAACPAIMSEINRLQSSLRQSAGRFGFFGFGPSPADQLRSALAVNRCDAPQMGVSGARTLCVRTCDGYHFPVTTGSGSDYQADAQVCRSTYGDAAKAELYVAPADANIADAQSLTGKRYGDQPYAFSYRTQFNPACAAELHEGIAARASGVSAEAAAPTATAIADIVPIPEIRPRLSEDPETLADAAGGLQPQPFMLTVVEVGPGGIRVVGAGYYNLILQQRAAAAKRGAQQP